MKFINFAHKKKVKGTTPEINTHMRSVDHQFEIEKKGVVLWETHWKYKGLLPTHLVVQCPEKLGNYPCTSVTV